jgi:hypothetical protein
VIHLIAVVAAGAASVRTAVELEWIGFLETAHDTHTGQDCDRESETGRKTSPKRMRNLH